MKGLTERSQVFVDKNRRVVKLPLPHWNVSPQVSQFSLAPPEHGDTIDSSSRMVTFCESIAQSQDRIVDELPLPNRYRRPGCRIPIHKFISEEVSQVQIRLKGRKITYYNWMTAKWLGYLLVCDLPHTKCVKYLLPTSDKS